MRAARSPLLRIGIPDEIAGAFDEVRGRQRREHRRLLDDLPQAHKRERDEPHEHHRPEEPADVAGAVPGVKGVANQLKLAMPTRAR